MTFQLLQTFKSEISTAQELQPIDIFAKITNTFITQNTNLEVQEHYSFDKIYLQLAYFVFSNSLKIMSDTQRQEIINFLSASTNQDSLSKMLFLVEQLEDDLLENSLKKAANNVSEWLDLPTEIDTAVLQQNLEQFLQFYSQV